ncbi:MAG: CBS domain-containing protein [Planctomycetaceae bacterium]
MPFLPGRLDSLTAGDIMTEKLVVLLETDTIQHAANLFRDLRISGAPVVDAAGNLQGLLSTADVIPAVSARLAAASARPAPQSHADEWDEIWRALTSGPQQHEAGASEPVGKWMSRRVASVRDDLALVEVARIMCDGHWHRVPVVDWNGQLRGIVSTMDVLAAVVQAVDEIAR